MKGEVEIDPMMAIKVSILAGSEIQVGLGIGYKSDSRVFKPRF